jgi:uridine kinase
MTEVLISNDSFYNKDYEKTFSYNQEYKFVSVNSGTSTLVPFYKDLLREVLGDAIDEPFKDLALGTAQTQQVKDIFIVQIEECLPKSEQEEGTQPHRRLEYGGKTYDLNLSLYSPNNRRIWDFNQIIQIATECLDESKPMYISIE